MSNHEELHKYLLGAMGPPVTKSQVSKLAKCVKSEFEENKIYTRENDADDLVITCLQEDIAQKRLMEDYGPMDPYSSEGLDKMDFLMDRVNKKHVFDLIMKKHSQKETKTKSQKPLLFYKLSGGPTREKFEVEGKKLSQADLTTLFAGVTNLNAIGGRSDEMVYVVTPAGKASKSSLAGLSNTKVVTLGLFLNHILSPKQEQEFFDSFDAL